MLSVNILPAWCYKTKRLFRTTFDNGISCYQSAQFLKSRLCGSKLHTIIRMLPSPLDEPDLDLSLPHTYQVEDSFELPGSGESDIPRVYIPSPVNRMEQAGTWLNVRASSGFVWTGVFAYGLGGPSGCSRIMSFPDPERVIVVSRGAAYLVKADDPYGAVLLPITPVTDARPIAKLQLVLFVGFSSLFAYGFDGLLWKSDFGVDHLRLIRVDDDRIEVQGYDPSSGQTVGFVFNFKTGASHSL